MEEILKQGMKPLNVEEFKKLMTEDTVILDTRNSTVFTNGFVPGSVSIGLDGPFTEWAGSLLPFDAPLLLVSEPGKEKESIIRLAGVGLDKVQGYLQGSYEAWKKNGEESDIIIDVEADELMMDIPFDKNLVIVDVRKPVEFGEGHLQDAINIPLTELTDPVSMANIEDKHNLYIHCGSGYCSVIAASLFKRQGIHNIRNISGGWAKIKEQEKIDIVKEASMLN